MPVDYPPTTFVNVLYPGPNSNNLFALQRPYPVKIALNNSGSGVAYITYQTLDGQVTQEPLASTATSVRSLENIYGWSVDTTQGGGTSLILEIVHNQDIDPKFLASTNVIGSVTTIASGIIQTNIAQAGGVTSPPEGGSVASLITNSVLNVSGVVDANIKNAIIDVSGAVDASIKNATLNISGIVNIGGVPNVNITNAVLDISGAVDSTIKNAILNVSGVVNANITNATIPVSGTINANILNAIIPVSGSVSASITNATIPVSGIVDAFITNAQFTVSGIVNATGTLNANILNAYIPVSGNVNATIANAFIPVSGNVNANISNATINVSGIVNSQIQNAVLNVSGAIYNTVQTNTNITNAVLDISGTVNANIQNAYIPVSGSVTATITNATFDISGTVDATIKNAVLNVSGAIYNIVQTNTNITNAYIPVSGNVTANISNAVIDVSGTVNSFITNATIPVSGTVNANIINATIPVSGILNANILNAAINVSGAVNVSNTVNTNITNSILEISGIVGINNAILNVSGTVNSNITNALINVSGAVNANITNAVIPVSGNVNANITNAAFNVSGTVNAQIQNAAFNVSLGTSNVSGVLTAPAGYLQEGGTGINQIVNPYGGGINTQTYNPWNFNLGSLVTVSSGVYGGNYSQANVQQSGAKGYLNFNFQVYNTAGSSGVATFPIFLYDQLPTNFSYANPAVIGTDPSGVFVGPKNLVQLTTPKIGGHASQWISGIVPDLYWPYDSLVVVGPGAGTGDNGKPIVPLIGLAVPNTPNIIDSHNYSTTSGLNNWNNAGNGFVGFWSVTNSSPQAVPVSIINNASVNIAGSSDTSFSLSSFVIFTNTLLEVNIGAPPIGYKWEILSANIVLVNFPEEIFPPTAVNIDLYDVPSNFIGATIGTYIGGLTTPIIPGDGTGGHCNVIISPLTTISDYSYYPTVNNLNQTSRLINISAPWIILSGHTLAIEGMCLNPSSNSQVSCDINFNILQTKI